MLTAKYITAISSALVIAGTFTACGGGGGGGGSDFIGPAEVELQASPSTIDIGDNVRVTAVVTQVNDDGIALKFKYPKELAYVPDSAYLFIGDTKKNISPTVNASDSDDTYLVFYLAQSRFSEDHNGSIVVDLKANETVAKASIGVDADVDDPLIDNATEFAIATPRFEVVDELTITIKGS